MKILFVCRGNVGRSQMAEALFRKMTGDKYEVSSAGTKLSGPEQKLKELPLAENLIKCMEEEGIDVSDCIRNPVTQEMVESANKVVLIIGEEDFVPDYLINNPKVSKWITPDPKGQDLDFHRMVRDQIKIKLETLIQTLLT